MSKRLDCLNCQELHSVKVFADGTYCFACQDRTSQYKSILISNNINKKDISQVGTLYKELPKIAKKWLSKYYITYDHINKYNIGWSMNLRRLIFPYKVENEILFGWCRSLEPETKAKWLYIGQEYSLYFLETSAKQNSNELWVCEDVVSAIRISDYRNVLCLGGTSNKSKELLGLLKTFKKIVLWLDGDKAGIEGALRFQKKYGLLFQIEIFKTKKDPKEHSPIEMDKIFNEYRNQLITGIIK